MGGLIAPALTPSAPVRSSAARAALRGASPLPHLLQRGHAWGRGVACLDACLKTGGAADAPVEKSSQGNKAGNHGLTGLVRCNKCGSGLVPRSAARAALDISSPTPLEPGPSRSATRPHSTSCNTFESHNPLTTPMFPQTLLRGKHMDRAQSHLLRRGRFSQPGNIYLITTVTTNRHRTFADLWFARAVIYQLRQAEREEACHSLAWVLMPDHLHWLIQLKDSTLCSLMRRFKSRSSHALYRQGLPRRRVWQAGYQDRALRRENDILKVARYVICNPLRAGLVTRVGDYPHWDAVWV